MRARTSDAALTMTICTRSSRRLLSHHIRGRLFTAKTACRACSRMVTRVSVATRHTVASPEGGPDLGEGRQGDWRSGPCPSLGERASGPYRKPRRAHAKAALTINGCREGRGRQVFAATLDGLVAWGRPREAGRTRPPRGESSPQDRPPSQWYRLWSSPSAVDRHWNPPEASAAFLRDKNHT
jgi:hypothetical protein